MKFGPLYMAPFPPSSKQLLRMQSVTPESKLPGMQYYDTEKFSAHILTSPQSKADTRLERHSDLWFDDGSVICQAENTLFKVHMSQLARHSVCFRDMFSLPQPVPTCCSSSDLSYACTGGPQPSHKTPVIQLHDTAEDVGNLLTALYDGPCVDYLCVAGEINSSSAHKAISEITVTKTFELSLGSFVYPPSTSLIPCVRKRSHILVSHGRLI
jgi:hypothetical protein